VRFRTCFWRTIFSRGSLSLAFLLLEARVCFILLLSLLIMAWKSSRRQRRAPSLTGDLCLILLLFIMARETYFISAVGQRKILEPRLREITPDKTFARPSLRHTARPRDAKAECPSCGSPSILLRFPSPQRAPISQAQCRPSCVPPPTLDRFAS